MHPHEHGQDCCHATPAKPGALKAAHHATVHCLTGCVIGEFIGLAIGAHMGLTPWTISLTSSTLAYVTGFALSLFPLMKRAGLSLGGAFRAIWIGEVVSIGVMEIVMNIVDYQMGGMGARTVLSVRFWQGLLFAVPAGYLAALPVNAWLIGKQLKKCH